MESILQQYPIDGVWHFTDRSNLASIKGNGGLFSLRELRRLGIKIPAPGGNDWSHEADEGKGVDDFVHLALLNQHPMEYVARKDGRIKDTVWLKIDPSILLEKGTRFCSDVSNKTGVGVLTSQQAKNAIDFEVLFTRMAWSDPAIYQRRQAAEKSEVLVPQFIPLNKIIHGL